MGMKWNFGNGLVWEYNFGNGMKFWKLNGMVWEWNFNMEWKWIFQNGILEIEFWNFRSGIL